MAEIRRTLLTMGIGTMYSCIVASFRPFSGAFVCFAAFHASTAWYLAMT
jgi:hypothetical protein